MPAYRVEFVKSAKKEFDGLDRRTQDRLLEALFLLSQNPFSDLLRFKKLKGADALYRIRVGDYRVVYEVRNELLLILVIKIGHRREVYPGL
jgi:mRNA interferase RelE/StbE